MKTELTYLERKSIFLILATIILLFLFFKGCDRKINNIDPKQKSIDSLKTLFQKSEAKIKTYESEIDVLNEDLLKANNNSQISETKYYNLLKKSKKPIYIQNVKDCNDTIQSIYAFSVQKDSLCNIALSDKTQIIKYQDTIIKKNDTIKVEFGKMVLYQKNEIANLNDIIEIEQKEVRKQSLQKNIYKGTTIGLLGLLIKILVFK